MINAPAHPSLTPKALPPLPLTPASNPSGGSTPIGANTGVSANAVVGVAAQQPVQASADSEVQARVDETIAFAESHHGDPAYVIEQTMNDPSLSQAQKDEYIAQLVELSEATVCTVDGSAERAAGKLQKAFEDIGIAYTGPATPELRQKVTDAIARNVDSGRLDADSLYNLVDPADGVSDGTRQLLTGITDGAVLNELAHKVLTEAGHMGYNVTKNQQGAPALVAAADIANMAADHGWTAAANDVVREIDRQMENGPVSGKMNVVQAMMASTVQGSPYGNSPTGRTGFEALSALVNNTDQTKADVAAATNRVFGGIVRTGSDEYVGGIDQFNGDKAAALNELGTYFNTHVATLVEHDWGYANSGGPENGTVLNFVQNVLFNEDYGMREQTATTITEEMTRLAGVIDTHGRAGGDMDTASKAAKSFATLTGSIEEAGSRFVAGAKNDQQERVDLIRQFTDLVTDKIADKGGPAGDIAGGALVDAFWQSMVDRAEGGAQAYVDDQSGGMINCAEDLRRAMYDPGIDSRVIQDYDDRMKLYHDRPVE